MFNINRCNSLYKFLCTICFRKHTPKFIRTKLRFIHWSPGNVSAKYPKKLSALKLYKRHNYNFVNDTLYPNNLRLLLNNLDFDIKHCNRIYRSDIEKILEDFDSGGKMSEADGMLLLQSVGDLLIDQLPEERIKLIWKIWNTLRNKGITSLELYHVLLTSLATNKGAIKAEEMLNVIENDGITPSELTYSLLLVCLCECDNMANAVKLVNTMKNRAVQLNEIGFGALMYGYEKLGDMKNSADILEMMELKKIAPTSKIYCNLLRGIAETSNEERFGKIWYQMTSRGIKLMEKERLSVIRSLSKGNLHAIIPHVLGEIKVQNYKLPIIANFCVELAYLGMHESVFIILERFNEYLFAVYNNKPYIVYIIEEMLNTKKVPVSQIITFCSKLDDKVSHLLHTVAYATLSNQLTEEAYFVFKEMLSKGLVIRPHYFWPLIIAEVKKYGETGILNVLKNMVKNCYVMPDFETLCYYVYPNMDLNHRLLSLRKLQDLGLPMSCLLTPLVGALLDSCRMQDAIEVCETVRGKVYYSYIENILINAFLKTGDVESTIKIIQILKVPNAVGNFLIQICTQKKIPVTASLLKETIEAFSRIDVAVSWSAIEEVKNYIHKCGFDDLEDQQIINKLTISYAETPHIKHPKDMDLEELEDHFIQLKSKGMNTRGALRRLLIIHSGQGNIERVRHLLQDIRENKHSLSPGMKASLVEVFARHNDIDTAMLFLRELKEEVPDFKIDSFKYVNLACALVNNNKFEEAIDILAIQDSMVKTEMLSHRCWSLLNSVAEKCTPEETKMMLNKLVDYNYCNYSGRLMGPIIKSYLRRGDAIGAANEFLTVAEAYHIAPMKHEVICGLIQCKSEKINTEELLERVLCASRCVHGNNVTNVAYIIALAELNCIKQLRSFLNNSTSTIDTKILTNECNRLSDRNKLKSLLNLAKVFADFPRLDVDPIYVNILKIYSRTHDYDSSVKLLTMIEETGRKPSQEFLSLFSSLQKNEQLNSC